MAVSGPISFSCGRCGHATQVSADHAGRRGRCGGCREVLRVPTPERDVNRCRGCTRAMKDGIEYCARCTRPTVLRLTLVSLLFMVLGAPPAGICGAITLAAAQEGQKVQFLAMVAIVTGTAACAGAIDFLRAMHALATGRDEVQPLATSRFLHKFA